MNPITGSPPTPNTLTGLSPAGGCAAKMCSSQLRRVLDDAGLGQQSTPVEGVLVGSETADDAAVVELDGSTLLLTTDAATPVHDDPAVWGRIQTSNCLSDIWAQGGTPELAMVVLIWPESLPLGDASKVMRSVKESLAKHNVRLLGGHTLSGPAPTLGLTIVGLLGDRVLTLNSTARVGDVLVLTKPLGTGIVVNAIRLGLCSPELEAKAVAIMSDTNGRAADAVQSVDVSAVTDITGFGLLGHAREMADASGVTLAVSASALPLLDGVYELVARGLETGGGERNRRDHMDAAVGDVSDETAVLLCDPQTSGGLLIAVAPAGLRALLSRLGAGAAIVGEVVERGASSISLVAS